MNKTFVVCADIGFGLSSEFDEDVSFWDYWIYGVLNICVAIPGLVLNILGAYILFRRKHRGLFVDLMLSLFVIDSVVLTTTILTQGLLNLGGYNSFIVYAYPYLLYPCFYASLYGSVWMTIVMSYERYKALKDPVGYRQRSGRSEFQKRRLIIFVCAVVLFSCVSNIVRFFHYKIAYVSKTIHQLYDMQSKDIILNPDDTLDVGIPEPKFPYLQETIVSKDPTFTNFVFWWDFLFRAMLPLILLIFLNFNIYKFIKRETRQIQKNLESSPENVMRSQEVKLAKTLLAIVVAFIICYLPWYVPQLLDAIKKLHCPEKRITTDTLSPICCIQDQIWYHVWSDFSSVLITLNSSINVILYGFSGEKFRNEVKSSLCNPFQRLLKCSFLKKLEIWQDNSSPSLKVYHNTGSTKTTIVSTESAEKYIKM